MPRKGKRAELLLPYKGIWGKFYLGDHVFVDYVLTNVDLDRDKEKLTYILPVREILDTKELPFEHLLQRDLDDARTADEIINGYLSSEETHSPIFFPPITVAILPRKEKRVGSFYPPRSKKDDKDEEGYSYEELSFNDAFNVRIYTEGGKRTQDCLLSINPSKTYQLAIDGQHRLMAVKACALGIQSIPDIYRPLYGGIESTSLEEVHLPVCFLYFPQLDDNAPGEFEDLIITSRRIFLDVNKNARKPAKSREILLDDYDLVNIFVRDVFSSIKENSGPLKLYHTEYDSQSGTKMTRPLAVIDVYNLHEIITRVLLSGSTICSDLKVKFRETRDQDFLRQELAIEDNISSGFFGKHGIERADVTSENLPPAVSRRISEECFKPYWCQVILTTLEEFYPYKIHLEAITELMEKIDSNPLSLEEKLARAMLFEGQGLWWICREKAKVVAGRDEPASKAVKIAERWVREFQVERAKKYLKTTKNVGPESDGVRKVNSLYDLFTSKAFQVGLFMAIAYLKHQLKVKAEELNQLAKEFIDSVNDKFSTKPIREVLFQREEKESIRRCYKNRKLTKNDWPFMRAVLLSLL